MRELLAEARMVRERAVRRRPDALHVEPAVRPFQGSGVEQADRPHVHVSVVILDAEKARVESGQAVVVRVAHRGSFLGRYIVHEACHRPSAAEQDVPPLVFREPGILGA